MVREENGYLQENVLQWHACILILLIKDIARLYRAALKY